MKGGFPLCTFYNDKKKWRKKYTYTRQSILKDYIHLAM